MDDPLIEPGRAQELMQRLPLAMVLLERDGRIAWSNQRFDKLFDPDTFSASGLPDHGDASRRIVLAARNGKPVEVMVHCLQAARYRMLVFDDTPGQIDSAALRELHARIGELERESMVDGLTGAWSRRYLDYAWAAELARSRRYRQPLAAVLFDIDRFRVVNDKFGHQAGDNALRELMQVTRKCMRAADILVRWGGEEFFIFMPYTDHRAAAAAAEKLRAAVAGHLFAVVGRMTVSLGAAEFLVGEEADAFFTRIDDAMHRAKREGRNRVACDAVGASDGWEGPQAGVMRLVWREEYLCGEPVIDAEHQELFKLVNEVIGASLQQSRGQAAFLGALDRCLTYVARHFAVEEKILRAKGYGGLVRHQIAHRALLDRAKTLRLAAQNGEVSTAVLVEFLAREVVSQHLLAVDREFFPLFAPAQAIE